MNGEAWGLNRTPWQGARTDEGGVEIEPDALARHPYRRGEWEDRNGCLAKATLPKPVTWVGPALQVDRKGGTILGGQDPIRKTIHGLSAGNENSRLFQED